MNHPRNAMPLAKLTCSLSLTSLLVFSSTLLAQQPQLRSTLSGHTGEVRSVAISPDGKYLASTSEDHTIRLWNLTSAKEPAALDMVDAPYTETLAFSPDGKTLASGGVGNKIKLWNVETRSATTLFDSRRQAGAPLVVFSPDGKMLASGGRCISEIRLFEVSTGKNTATLKGYDLYGVRALAFTPNGKTLLSVGYHGGIKKWDVAAGKEEKCALNPADAQRTDKLIESLGDLKFVERDKAAKEIEAMGPLAIEPLKRAAKNPDEEIRNRVGRLIASFKANAITAQSVPCAAFSTDCQTLATAIHDLIVDEGGRNVIKETGGIKLWETFTGKQRTALNGHTGEVCSLVFSPDGKMLATGSEDDTIKLWELSTNKELATLKGHSGKVTALAFGADGKTLASGSEDKTIKIWDVSKVK